MIRAAPLDKPPEEVTRAWVAAGSHPWRPISAAMQIIVAVWCLCQLTTGVTPTGLCNDDTPTRKVEGPEMNSSVAAAGQQARGGTVQTRYRQGWHSLPSRGVAVKIQTTPLRPEPVKAQVTPASDLRTRMWLIREEAHYEA